MSSETAAARVQRHREKTRKKGLVRVEVSVPKDYVNQLKQYAENLRAKAQSGHLEEVRGLVRVAIGQYRASCLDNIEVDPDRADLEEARVVAQALMERGNTSAFELGRKLRKLSRS